MTQNKIFTQNVNSAWIFKNRPVYKVKSSKKQQITKDKKKEKKR